MIIQATKRLLDELGLRRRWIAHVGKKEYPRGLYDWYAHVQDFEGQMGIVLANNLTRYPVVLLKNEEFCVEKIPEYILETLRSEGIHETILEAYRSQMGMMLIDKTGDQELTQKLSYTCEEVRRCTYLFDRTVCVQTKIAKEAAKMRVRYCDIAYRAPSEIMTEQLERLKREMKLDVALFDIEQLDLLISLEIPGEKAEVRINVPSNITFLLLHELILKLFDWNAKGEYCFLSDGNAVDEICELKEIDWTAGVKYEYRMPGYSKWIHTIRLMGIKPHHPVKSASVAACRGQRPPWTLNPEYYREYQSALENEDHPEHEKAQLLRHRYGARRLSLREMNVELRWVMMNSIRRK